MKRVLVVDDSNVSRKILVNMLEQSGYTVVGEAVDGKEGYELYKQFNPDVVTMDISMPVMNGLESLKLIREYDPDAKIIILSAKGHNEMLEEAGKLGAVKFVKKPYQKREVFDAIDEC